MSANVVSFACEFPNDNPALHAGTVWVCLEPTGMAVAERSAQTMSLPELPPPIVEAAPPTLVDEVVDIVEDVVIIEDLEPLDDVELEVAPPTIVDSIVPQFEEVPIVEARPETRTSALPPPPDDPFTVLVCTLADVAIGAGSPHVAALLPGLLFDGRVPEPLEGPAEATLRSGGLWNGVEIDATFIATACAWRGILRGTSDDFDACGAAMLDEWASELLARLLEEKSAAPRLRQELRSRGVAAFGLSGM